MVDRHGVTRALWARTGPADRPTRTSPTFSAGPRPGRTRTVRGTRTLRAARAGPRPGRTRTVRGTRTLRAARAGPRPLGQRIAEPSPEIIGAAPQVSPPR